MAEARSYARQGQFRGKLQTSQTATAQRQRDKEMVAELKEENRALKQRDAEFLAAYKEKLNNEKAARANVEQARRYSVESERQQRITNFNLAADFAEQEQRARNEALEAFGDMLPKVGQYFEDEGKRREEAETAAADAAWRKSGLTPEEIKEYSQVSWTADLLASKKYANLRAKLELGGISPKQFMDAIHRQGAWGTSLARYELGEQAKALPSLVTQAVENGYERNGVLLGDALSGEVPGNDRSVIDQFISETLGKVGADYSPAFVEETIGEQLSRWRNGLQATRYDKENEQALAHHNDVQLRSLKGYLSSPSAYEAMLGAYPTDRARFGKVKQDVERLIGAIETGEIPHDSPLIDNIRKVQVFNPSLNGGEGGMNAVGKDTRLGVRLDAARAKRQRQVLSEGEASRQMENEFNKQLTHDHIRAMDDMTPSQAVEYIRGVMDSDAPLPVKHALSQYVTKTDPGAALTNWEIDRQIDYNIKHGIPIDPALLRGASGEVYARGQKLIAQQNSMATYDKVAKDVTKEWIDSITGKDNNFDRGHKDFAQVHMLLQRRYKEIQQGLIERRGTNGLTDKEIHNTAIEQLKNEWDKDTTGDEAGRTGQFRYIEGEDPTTGQFTNAYQLGGPRVQPKISKAHKQWGDKLVDQPEAVFTKSRTESFQEGTGAITKSDWDRARDTADLLGITAPEVIVRQMLANGDTPPPELVQSADARRTLNDISYNMNQTFRNTSLLGEQNLDWLHASANANSNAIPGITRIIGPYGVQGVTSVPTDTNAAHSGPIKGHYDVEFASPELALYVGKYLIANGVIATEHPGLPGGIQGRHAQYGRSHYNGFKIDIPFSQTGSTGAIGTDLDKAFAIRVMQLMREAATQFYNRA